MNSKIRTGLIAAGGLIAGLVIGSAGSSEATPPTATPPAITITQTVPGPAGKTVEVPGPVTTVTVTAPPAETEPALSEPVGSTCDIAREAILTGTKGDIEKAFKALIADKTADSTAREYARYYLGRDAGNKQLQEMDITLIQSACSL